jgi:hypothetical protein
LRAFHFDRRAAVTTDQMVVVSIAGATAIANFPVVTSQCVEFARVDERSYLVVDGRQRNVLTFGQEFSVEFLSGTKPLGGVEDRGKGSLLSG